MKKTARKPARAKKSPGKLKARKSPARTESSDKPADAEESRQMPKIKFDAKTRKEFKAVLLRLRDRLTGQMTTLKDESLSRDDVVDLAEDGTDAFDRQFALNLVSSEQDSVFEIDEALKRIDDGTYGLCEGCFKQIGSSRIKALPFVKLCIKCQSGLEKSKPVLKPLQALKGL